MVLLCLDGVAQVRAELAEKGLVLMEKEKELLQQEQTLTVLREEVCPLLHIINAGQQSCAHLVGAI